MVGSHKIRKKGSQRIRAASPEHSRSGSGLALSRDRIVAAAVELLDAHGVDGFTMRGLAEKLGSWVMSLYWHVDSKEYVFDLALDAVLKYRRSSVTADYRGWREEVIDVIVDWRICMLSHSWSASLLPHRELGPNLLHRLELLGRTLSVAGIADDDLNVAIWSLWNYVMGATITMTSSHRSDDHRVAAQKHLARLEDQYPLIGRTQLLLDDDWDSTFHKGLDFLLDGIVPAARPSAPLDGT